jgi:hypothetical protein
MYRNYTWGLVSYQPILKNGPSSTDLFTEMSISPENFNYNNGKLEINNLTYTHDRNGEMDNAIGAQERPTHTNIPSDFFLTKQNSPSNVFSFLVWVRVAWCDKPLVLYLKDMSYAFGIVSHENISCELSAYYKFNNTEAQMNIRNGLPINGSVWTHLAMIVNGPGEDRANMQMQIYVNGELIFTDKNFLPLHLTPVFDVCMINGGVDLDEIKFFNRTLSAGEIEFDYKHIKSFIFKL